MYNSSLSKKYRLLFFFGLPLTLITILFSLKRNHDSSRFFKNFSLEKMFTPNKKNSLASSHKTFTPYHPRSETIISLSPHLTQMVIDLGRRDTLVALSEGFHHPKEVDHLPKVKFSSKTDLASLVAFQPSAILGIPPSTLFDQSRFYEVGSYEMGSSDSPIEVISTQNLYSFADVFSLLRRVNMILDKNTILADEFIVEKKQKLDLILKQTQNLPKSTVAFVYPVASEKSEKQEVISIAGKGTPEEEALSFAGAQNLFPQLVGYQTISLQELVKGNPQWIVVHPAFLENLSKQKELSSWFQKNRVLVVDTSAFVSSRLEEATLQLAKLLHPGQNITW